MINQPEAGWQDRARQKTKSDQDRSAREDQVVVMMDFSGGFRAATPGFQREPTLRIFADGRVRCGVAMPGRQPAEARLDPEHFREVMDFLVKKQQFLEISHEQVAEELAGYTSMMADGLTTTIRVDWEGQSNELSVYVLRMTARELPEAEALQRLAAIENYLRHIKLLGDLGGKMVLEDLLATANEKLELELLNAEPWTVEHLRRPERLGQDGLKVLFSRARAAGRDGYNISMELQRSAADQPWQIELKTW